MLIPLFVLLLLLGREEDKKTRSVLLVSQLVASKGCPLSAGCWSSLLRGSRIQQPNLKKGKKKALSRLELWSLPSYYEKAFTGLLSACAKEFRAKGWSVGSIGSQNPRRELTPFLQSSFMRKKCSKYFLRKKLSVSWIRSSVSMNMN